MTTTIDASGGEVRVAGLDLVGEIGRGAQTVVHRGRRDGVEYAVKISRDALDDDAAGAFAREAAVLSCIRHPSLPDVYEVGTAGGRPYLVMELVQGRTLAQVLADGPLDPEAATSIGIDLAGALGKAHAFGLVHQDVKPENIILAADGRARLIDFGLVGRAGITADDVAVGTLLYSAPEQSGLLKRPIDGRSDLYSLGAVLFECVTGQPPFAAADAAELLRHHAATVAPSIADLAPEVPQQVADVVARLLAKDPDDRYQRAADVVEALGGDARDQDGLPLVGRLREMGVVRKVASSAAAEAQILVVRGGLGIGKTRFSEEIARIATRRGRLVLRARCAPGETTPLGPVRRAIDVLLHDVLGRPAADREQALDLIRAAAGDAAPLLRSLTPSLAAVLGDTGVEAAPVSAEQFQAAVIRMLRTLAEDAGGALLWLDDFHAADDATVSLLRRLVGEQAPLLVLLSGSSDADGGAGTSILDDIAPSTSIELGPLDASAVGELVTAFLGRAASDSLAEQLFTRCGGNPLAVVEYLQAILDGGFVRPDWGRAHVDPLALDALALSSDVVELVLRRLDDVSGSARTVLAAAAVLGTRFAGELLPAAADVSTERVFEALTGGLTARVIEQLPGGGWAFVHERVREALIDGLDNAGRMAVHQRAADAIEAQGDAGPGRVYALARHLALGEVERDPRRAFAANMAAAEAALADHAAVDACGYVEAASAAAAVAGIELDAAAHALAGDAFNRARRWEEAAAHLEQAVALEQDRWCKARSMKTIAWLHHGSGHYERAVDQAEAALAVVGHGLSRRRLSLLASTLARVVAALVCRRRWQGFGTASGESAERYGIRLELHGVASAAAYMVNRPARTFLHVLWSLYPAKRVGPGVEYVRVHSGLAMAAALLKRRKRLERDLPWIDEMAQELGDPAVSGRIVAQRGFTYELLGDPVRSADALSKALREHGRWMESSLYVTTLSALVANLFYRGHTAEALRWYERGDAIPGVRHALDADQSPFRELLQGLHGRRSRSDEELLAGVTAAAEAGDMKQASYIASMLLGLRLEQGEVDELVVRLLDGLDERCADPRRASAWDRPMWGTLAAGRILQLRLASPEDRPAADAAARDALRRLRKAANGPMLRSQLRLLEAARETLAGDPAKALKLLAEADEAAMSLDAPTLRFRILLERARALLALGQEAEARFQGGLAVAVATGSGWPLRAAAARKELGLTTGPSATAGGTASGGSSLGSRSDRRRLDALLQVSASAATILDPNELARVALDEVIGILGAERAFLFLGDDPSRLDVFAGRDAARNELDAADGYSSTLVVRAFSEERAFVLAGTDEGAAHGSDSAVVHGLRSILVAPLQLDGKTLGVVYLDSRLAKGMFTDGDVEILLAIAKQVAISLQTARAAQLEVAVQAERQQRLLAEVLRDVVTDAGATLDPDEVLDRFLGTARRALPYEAACVVLASPGEPARILAAAGPGAEDVRGTEPPVDHLAKTLGGVAVVESSFGTPPVPGMLVGPCSWLAVPVVLQDGLRAAFVVASSSSPYTEGQLDLASTLVSHALLAYQNARLFSEVERLAVTDELTGLCNRRSFFAEASERFADGPVAAVMVDVDRFKAVNDRFGHGVGDDVIREVAARVSSVARSTDVVGRLGGEEFALVLCGSAEAAVAAAGRIRDAVAAAPVETRSGPVDVTVSVGVASTTVGDGAVDEVLGRADQALYEAKETGRDRVVRR